jgi:hypothetical protein
MGRRVMAKKLLGTTALVGGVLAGGALSASDALAQALCPASSVTGTGNVSNAVCNAVGTPLPFTLTLNLNVTDVAAANTNAKTDAPGGLNVPGYANSGGPGHHDFGFMESGWMRFTFDAPAEGDQHYGYHMRLIIASRRRPPRKRMDSPPPARMRNTSTTRSRTRRPTSIANGSIGRAQNGARSRSVPKEAVFRACSWRQ